MKVFVTIFFMVFMAVFVFADVTLIYDPSFVRLTAVANPSHSLWWATDYVLEIEALNRSMPVEVSYLILGNNGTPARPSEGIHIRGSNFIEGWDGTSLFQTEVGGWASPEFQQNPKFLPLPHYHTCILMLARYEKIYLVVIRENDGQISYKVLEGGPFNLLEIPFVVRVEREGSKFVVTSLGQPVEVGLWQRVTTCMTRSVDGQVLVTLRR